MPSLKVANVLSPVYPNGSTVMSWGLVLHLDRNGDKPPARPLGNNRAHDFASEPQRLSHIDFAKFGNAYPVSLDKKLIVIEVETQLIFLLALEMGKACFFPILTGVFEFGLCCVPLHAPIVLKCLSKMAKLLFRSAFCHFRTPRELLTLNAVVLGFQFAHLDSFPLSTRLFPAC